MKFILSINATVLFLTLSLHSFSQWSPQSNVQPQNINVIKGLRVPITNSTISPWSDRDSIGQLIFNPTALKFMGRFSTSVFKNLASEDSITRTLEDVLRAGNVSQRNIILGQTSGGNYYGFVGFSDYARLQFTSTGDIGGNSNLVATVGDNNDNAEGFIWRKDTANNGGTSPLFDTLATMQSNAFRVFKPISAMNTYVQASNGTVNSILFYNGTSSGTVGTFTNHPFDIYSAGNPRIRILTDGKVGIGTLAPAEALSVTGNIIASAPTYSSGGFTYLVRNSSSGRFESTGTPAAPTLDAVLIAGNTSTQNIGSVQSITTTGTSTFQSNINVAGTGTFALSARIGSASLPGSTLQVDGSVQFGTRTITATTTLNTSDRNVFCNNTTAITVTLPSAAGIAGREYTVWKINPATANILINASAGNVNGGASVTITSNLSSYNFVSDGTNWYIH